MKKLSDLGKFISRLKTLEPGAYFYHPKFSSNHRMAIAIAQTLTDKLYTTKKTPRGEGRNIWRIE